MKFFFAVLAWLTLISTVTATCNDKAASIIKHYPALATPFCRKWLHIAPTTVTVTQTAQVSPKKDALTPRALPNYNTIPPGVRTFAKSKISSACKCLSLKPSTVKVTHTVQPTSITSTTTTTSTTSSTDGQSPPSPSCNAKWSLSGIEENGFNAAGASFTASIACSTLDNDMVVVYSNGVEVPSTSYTVSGNSIQFPNGLEAGSTVLALMALDTNGYPFVSTYQLLFGSLSLSVSLTDANGNPVANADVQADTTQFQGFSQKASTDGNGQASFSNLPPGTIELIARTADNQIAVAGVASSVGSVSMQLIPFNQPSEEANYDFSNGSDGWTGGQLVTHMEKRNEKSRRAYEAKKRLAKRADSDLVVTTGGTMTLQTASATFKTYPFTKTVFIRFKFVTSEIPGGYFGSQFNDYFVVTIRSDVGGLATMSNSMNALGRGAFDDSGATQWMQLQLSVPSNCKSVQFDIGVANVADSALDSKVIVDKAGDLTCDKCGDCSQCQGDPMCSDTCKTPQPNSCAFYRNCVEASVPCAGDASSYALNYGEKNCNAYFNNINLFSAKGQSFIRGTALCLQNALRPKVNCDSTCAFIKNTAFGSHSQCYVDNGFCGMTCLDYAAVVWTVGSDLYTSEAIPQIIETAGGCLQNIEQVFSKDSCGTSLAKITAAIVYVAITKRKFPGWDP